MSKRRYSKRLGGLHIHKCRYMNCPSHSMPTVAYHSHPDSDHKNHRCPICGRKCICKGESR